LASPLADQSANQLQSQGTNNLKKYWMPDEQCKVCYECGVKFHTFRRRHHCRLCGQIFCSRSDIEKNLKQLKEDLSLVAQPDSTNPAVSVHGFIQRLVETDHPPRTGLEFLTHRVRLRTYSTCFVGRDLMNWLMINRKAPNRPVALQICQGLQDLGWIEPLNTREPAFKDDISLYIPGPRASDELYYPDLRPPSSVPQGNNSYKGKREPVVFILYYKREIDNQMIKLIINFHKNFTHTTIIKIGLKTQKMNYGFSRVPGFVYQQQSIVFTHLMDGAFYTIRTNYRASNSRVKYISGGPSAQSPSLDVFVNVENCYLPKRLRSKENHQGLVVQSWIRSGLKYNCCFEKKIEVCQTVIPGVETDDEMDMRHYVKIKKIPGGSRSDCRIVNGVVCTKNVVNKKMAPIITQPLILMLACPVDFQLNKSLIENKMASLDSLVLQEEEFLKNMVGRIVALKPRMVLVEKTVSRLAQEMLFAKGISVILNIKPKLMARISRCVQGDVLPSLDQGSRPKLGTCQKFKIEKFIFKNGSTKTLSFFEGCNPNWAPQ
ncbi:1-phosphatidylinositol 3-phosphate 5-kinase-like isoform X3, partial [Paramuricea clavata]